MMSLDFVIDKLNNGEYCIDDYTIEYMNSVVNEFLKGTRLLNLEEVKKCIIISNIIYNNTPYSILPLEDGIYDLCVKKYNEVTNGGAPVGASPISFKTLPNQNIIQEIEETPVIVERINNKDKMLFFNDLVKNGKPIKEDFMHNTKAELISNPVKSVSHKYPQLVGTLDKCKFVLNSTAFASGIATNDDSVGIFERDFFAMNYLKGINVSDLIAELKYDGVSIEAEVKGDTIVSARSRGDTANDEATDYTGIFAGYKFPRATNIVDNNEVFGIKFEAIITYDNLRILANMGKIYKNARVAIIGILGSLEAKRYRDFITLVPIRTSLNIPNREVEIQFLNKYYSSGVDLRYKILHGDYVRLLYQVDKFVSEAEYMREFLPFMYDGVVVSYIDMNVKMVLGRINSVDKWSIAIKFNAFKKQTRFIGYKFTIGQNGLITPIAYFNQVEFLGTIHDKTTVHSLKRFKELNLRYNDIVEIEYRNDVICYLDKPYNPENDSNTNPVIEFPTVCPFCGRPLSISESGNSAYCVNEGCIERDIARMTNMLKKLNIKDFGKQSIRALHIYSLLDLFAVDEENAEVVLGKVLGEKLLERINEIKSNAYPDYRIIGSLGFTSIAIDKWKLILNSVSLDSIVRMGNEELFNLLRTIKGIGESTALTIINERNLMKKDLELILTMPNIIRTFGVIRKRVEIRFSGIRDKTLQDLLIAHGYDADGDKSVTRSTTYLIVPYEGYTSAKVVKANKYNVKIITEDYARYCLCK